LLFYRLSCGSDIPSKKKSSALELRIKVCMDPSLRLQGRFNSGLHRMQKSVFCPRDPEDATGDDGQHHYFMVDPDSGGGRKAAGAAGAFLKQAALWNRNRNRRNRNFLTS
jgi:hypothetical protein